MDGFEGAIPAPGDSTMRIAIAALAASIALSAVPPAAQARDGISPGAAAALGVLGGVAVGGALAAQSDGGYYPGKRIYSAPPVEREVVVVERRPRRIVVEEEVGPVCHFERRRGVDE